MGHRRRHDVFVTGNWAFLPHPCGERGHWTRTDRSVAFVACSYCNSGIGELCTNEKGQGKASTHVARRDAYQFRKKELDPDRATCSRSVVVELSDTEEG